MAEQLAWLRIALGAFMLVVGLLGLRYPYKVALIEELVDSIGSTTPIDAVEPAAWKVSLTKLSAAVVAFVGSGGFSSDSGRCNGEWGRPPVRLRV
jgi:hypothetical protein